ncbi:unnamed protein product, partial [Closterium sp. Yama58-4]
MRVPPSRVVAPRPMDSLGAKEQTGPKNDSGKRETLLPIFGTVTPDFVTIQGRPPSPLIFLVRACSDGANTSVPSSSSNDGSETNSGSHSSGSSEGNRAGDESQGPSVKCGGMECGGREFEELEALVSDFCGSSWRTRLSRDDLEDEKDDLGWGGSFAEFLALIRESLSSRHVSVAPALARARPNQAPLPASHLPSLDTITLTGRKAESAPRIRFKLKRVDWPGKDAGGGEGKTDAGVELPLPSHSHSLQSSSLEAIGSATSPASSPLFPSCESVAAEIAFALVRDRLQLEKTLRRASPGTDGSTSILASGRDGTVLSADNRRATPDLLVAEVAGTAAGTGGGAGERAGEGAGEGAGAGAGEGSAVAAAETEPGVSSVDYSSASSPPSIPSTAEGLQSIIGQWDRIPGSVLATSAQVQSFRDRFACISSNGRWRFNATPRLLPWPGEMSLCDERHLGAVPGAVAMREADRVVEEGRGEAQWKVREALKYEWRVEGDGEGRSVMIVGDSLNLQLAHALRYNARVGAEDPGARVRRGQISVLCRRVRDASYSPWLSLQRCWTAVLCGDVEARGEGGDVEGRSESSSSSSSEEGSPLSPARSSLEFNLSFVRDDYLLSPAWRNQWLTKRVHGSWVDDLRRENVSILIVNRGAHFTPHDSFAWEVSGQLAWLREQFPDLLVFVRGTPAGHRGCMRYDRPLEKKVERGNTSDSDMGEGGLEHVDKYNWDKLAQQNKIARRVAEAVGAVYMDVETIVMAAEEELRPVEANKDVPEAGEAAEEIKAVDAASEEGQEDDGSEDFNKLIPADDLDSDSSESEASEGEGEGDEEEEEEGRDEKREGESGVSLAVAQDQAEKKSALQAARLAREQKRADAAAERKERRALKDLLRRPWGNFRLQGEEGGAGGGDGGEDGGKEEVQGSDDEEDEEGEEGRVRRVPKGRGMMRGRMRKKRRKERKERRERRRRMKRKRARRAKRKGKRRRGRGEKGEEQEGREGDGAGHAAEESDSSEDERPSRNTVGRVPLEWYKEEGHIGYDREGKRIMKQKGRAAKGDKLDEFLAHTDDPDAWKVVYDEYNDEEIRLTEEDIDMIRRIREGRTPHANVNPYEPYLDWFDWDEKWDPLNAQPEPKRRFTPSKHEAKQIVRLVRGLRKGTIKTLAQREKERKQKESEGQQQAVYLMWGDDLKAIASQSDKTKNVNGLSFVPAPKPKLPGHEESYNPPVEYIPTEEEVAEKMMQAEYEGTSDSLFVPK